MLVFNKEGFYLTTETNKIILIRIFNQGIYLNITLLTAFFTLPFLFSCSQEKNTFVSKNFHNLTARDNAYFLAREKMKEVDDQIWKSNMDDYNEILDVHPEITPAIAGAIRSGVDEVIKKASLIPQKHKNSEWLDDSYIIIGKSYFYKDSLKSAMAFFKFVNSKSEDPDARHAALVFLMRAYIDSADYSSAKTVSDYLDKKTTEGGEKLSQNNFRDYMLAKALYHQKIEEYDQMIPLLEKAVDLIPAKDQRARTHFIIGQLYQRSGKDSSALAHYKTATKRNPPYDLLFHSKLYMVQVSGTEGKRTGKKMDKYFNKLLSDKKNTEFKDKIYYEMGNYELRRRNVPKAITNFEHSLLQESRNPNQKALSYLRLAEIYYNNESFEKSKLYYDSTVSLWDAKEKHYKTISTRQKVLAEFVGYVNTVKREDSLQKLRTLPKEKLDAYIDNVIALEKEKAQQQKEQEEARKKRAQSKPEPVQDPFAADNDNSTFALTNAVAIASGRAEFIKIWGNRKLEDNWRRSKKDNANNQEDIVAEQTENPGIDSTGKDNNEEQQAAVNKDNYYKDIPFTKDQLDSSNKRIEVSLYHIGKIYNQKLEEPDKSVKTFENLLTRFPASTYKPEIFYFLYLIQKDLNNQKASDSYKHKLLTEFPNSLYAKLIGNPNYLQDNQVANMKAHQKYKEAYLLYKNGQYKASDSLVAIIRSEFPDNDIPDKLDLLSILAFGQTGSPVVYQEKLNAFIGKFKYSPLTPKAKELLEASEAYIASQEKKGNTVTQTDVKFSTDLNKPHLLVAVLPASVSKNMLVNQFKAFNKEHSEKQKLTLQALNLSDTTWLMVVNGLEDKFSAQVYINKLKDEKSFFQKNGYIKHPLFIISNHNYQLFKDSKNIQGYLKFFKENY